MQGVAVCRTQNGPLWPSANAEARRGWDELLMRSGLTVENLYMMKAFT